MNLPTTRSTAIDASVCYLVLSMNHFQLKVWPSGSSRAAMPARRLTRLSRMSSGVDR